MRPLFFLLIFFATCAGATGQGVADTTIHTVAESFPIPLLRRCAPELHPGWPEDSIRRCAESELLSLLAQNIRYPEAARQANIQGVVATSFIVEKDGRMTDVKVLKDIGGGCGEEAVRVLKALGEAGLRWQPALIKNEAVRMRQVLPLRFRLEEEKPYYLSETGDSIYVDLDSAPVFLGGLDSLASFAVNRLEYPDNWLDSCKTGIIEMALVVQSNGNVLIGNQLDYNNLGLDFQFQAIRLANRTAGQWTPALYEGRRVSTTFPMRVLFKSSEEHCATANDRFDRAMILADEGAALYEQNQNEAAIAKWTEALRLHPDNTELLYYRGAALLALNRRDEACEDWNRVKAMLSVTWFEGVRRVICGW